MSKSNRKRNIMLACTMILCVIMLLIYNNNQEILSTDMYDYYIEHGAEETKMNNIVSAIYLDYRVFDTLFEALLLAISVTAISYFARPWEKEKEDDDE